MDPLVLSQIHRVILSLEREEETSCFGSKHIFCSLRFTLVTLLYCDVNLALHKLSCAVLRKTLRRTLTKAVGQEDPASLPPL